MINVVPRFILMNKHYTGDRVKSMVQFKMIEKNNNKRLKGDKSRIIIVLYYKQKILGIKFNARQVAYDGKMT